MTSTRSRFAWAALALAAAACSDMSRQGDGDLGNARVAADSAGASVEADEPQLEACPNVFSDAEAARRTPSGDDSVLNRLDVKADGRLSWNGDEVDAATLREYIEILSQMTPAPTLIVSFEPEVKPPARREIADAIAERLYCRPAGI